MIDLGETAFMASWKPLSFWFLDQKYKSNIGLDLGKREIVI